MLTAQVPVILRGSPPSGPPAAPAVTSYFDELWPGTAGAHFPVAWSIEIVDSDVQNGDGTATMVAQGYAIRDIGVSDFVLTATISPMVSGYPMLLFNCNSSTTSYSYLQFDESVGSKLSYGNYLGSPGGQVSDTTYPSASPPTNSYVVQLTKTGTSASVRVNGSVVLFSGASSFSVLAGAGLTWVGFKAAGATGSIFGEVKATA